MSKRLIKELDDKITQLGLRFRKKRIEFYDKQGSLHKIVIQQVRSAVEDRLTDRFGRFDDAASESNSKIELQHTIRLLYENVKYELNTRVKEGFGKYVLHEFAEAELLKPENFYTLYGWCKKMMRILKIDSPHDQMFLQPISDVEGMNIGVRYIPEDIIDREEGDTTKATPED